MSIETAISTTEIVHSTDVVDEWSLFEGAFASARSDEVVIDGRRYKPHPNGGGLVSISAFVASTAYVAPTARVEDNAIVLGTVRILDQAVVGGNATVEGRSELRGHSRVGGYASLTGMVTLRRHARVDGTARLESGVIIDCVAHISRGHLVGPLSIG